MFQRFNTSVKWRRDIGWQAYADLDPIFAFHAFSLIPGEISEPVRTSDGYSIVKLVSMENNNLLTQKDYQLKKEKAWQN